MNLLKTFIASLVLFSAFLALQALEDTRLQVSYLTEGIMIITQINNKSRALFFGFRNLSEF